MLFVLYIAIIIVAWIVGVFVLNSNFLLYALEYYVSFIGGPGAGGGAGSGMVEWHNYPHR